MNATSCFLAIFFSLFLFLSESLAQTLEFASPLGNNKNEFTRDVATDFLGNIYATGGGGKDISTNLQNYNIFANLSDQSLITPGSSSIDVHAMWVTKTDSSGNLIWATAIDGPKYERAYAIEVSPDGQFVYVGGRCGPNISMPSNVLQPHFGGGKNHPKYGNQDSCIFKLRSSDGSLVTGTYLGGADDDIIRDLAINEVGDRIAVFGATSMNIPLVDASPITPHQASLGGQRDLFILEFSSDFQTLHWGSYYGGSQDDGGTPSGRYASNGDIFVLQGAASPGLIRTNSIPYGGGLADLHLSRWDSRGNLLGGTYIGGSNSEWSETHGVAISPITGEVAIGGGTRSVDLLNNFPSNVYGFQPIFGGGACPINHFDGFLAVFDPRNFTPLAVSYLGGCGRDAVEGVTFDTTGRIAISGNTESTEQEFPISSDAFQGRHAGGHDAFVAVVSSQLSNVLYATYYGGSGNDVGRSIAVDPLGNIVCGGQSNSAQLPFLNPFQASVGGSEDAFILKFAATSTLELSSDDGEGSNNPNTSVCIHDPRSLGDASAKAVVAYILPGLTTPTLTPIFEDMTAGFHCQNYPFTAPSGTEVFGIGIRGQGQYYVTESTFTE